MGATRRGRSVRRAVVAGIAGVMALALGVSPVAAAPGPEDDGTGEPRSEAELLAEQVSELVSPFADTDEPFAAETAAPVIAGLPMLEPEVVLAEGRSARTGEAWLLDVGPEALVYRAEREGNWVAYGPGYTERRRVTEVLPPLWVAGEWVVGGGPDARRWVDVQHVTGGAVSTYPLSATAGFIAANADGWLEWSRTDRSVEVFQVTIGAGGAVTRASRGVVATLPTGDRIFEVFAGGVTSLDGTQTVANLLVFGQRRDGADRALEYRLLRFSAGPGAGEPEVIGSSRSIRDVVTPLQVTDDSVVVQGAHYFPDDNSVPELRRLRDGQWQVWRATGHVPAGSVTVIGDRVLWFEDGGRGRVEGLPDGRVVTVTDAWSGLPRDARSKSVGDDVVVGWGDRILRSGADPAGAQTLVELPAMPLRIGAFDLAAGTAAWVDDSTTTVADGSAWVRSLVLDADRIHLYDEAVGAPTTSYPASSAIHLAGGPVFGYRAVPESNTLVRAERRATAPVEIARVGYARAMLGGTTTVYVPDARGAYPNHGALIDVETNRMTPSPSIEALNDTWSVRYVDPTDPEITTLRATHLPTGGHRTVTFRGGTMGIGLVGSTLVWISLDLRSGTTLNTVNLSRGSAVMAIPFDEGAVVATDATHFAVRPANTTRGAVVTIHRLGSPAPVAAVESVYGQVAIDGGRVLWVEAGPDGDRLVSARIPGASLFTDVPPGSAFATEIEWLVESGIGTGYVDGTFRPGGTVSRQAMAAFLSRAERPDFTAPTAATFADVPPSSPFFREIEWMVDAGLATTTDGRFRPGDPVSRQAMAAYLYRAAGSPEFTAPVTPTFTDVPATSAFFAEIEWLAQTGITAGYADHTFRPGGQVSRQAMAAFLHRFEDLRG